MNIKVMLVYRSSEINRLTKIPYLKFDVVVLNCFHIKSNSCIRKTNASVMNSEQSNKLLDPITARQ